MSSPVDALAWIDLTWGRVVAVVPDCPVCGEEHVHEVARGVPEHMVFGSCRVAPCGTVYRLMPMQSAAPTPPLDGLEELCVVLFLEVEEVAELGLALDHLIAEAGDGSLTPAFHTAAEKVQSAALRALRALQAADVV